MEQCAKLWVFNLTCQALESVFLQCAMLNEFKTCDDCSYTASCKQDALSCVGRLGLLTHFLHGRLGLLVVKQLSEHASGRNAKLSTELSVGLQV